MAGLPVAQLPVAALVGETSIAVSRFTEPSPAGPPSQPAAPSHAAAPNAAAGFAAPPVVPERIGGWPSRPNPPAPSVVQRADNTTPLPVVREPAFSTVETARAGEVWQRIEADGSLTVQRVEEIEEPPPAPEPGPSPQAPATPAAAMSAPVPAAGPAAGMEPEELLKKLFDPLLRRLKTELRLDRERSGAPADRA